MSHRASALLNRSLAILTCVVVVPSAACAPAPEPAQERDVTAITPVSKTIDGIPSETVVRIVVIRDEGGNPTGLNVVPRSAVICTHPTKHCAGELSWAVEGGLATGDSLRISAVVDPDSRLPVPMEVLRVPELVIEGGREIDLPLFTIPDDYRLQEPKLGEEVVNVFYAVELTGRDGSSILFDPRVIIDRTR